MHYRLNRGPLPLLKKLSVDKTVKNSLILAPESDWVPVGVFKMFMFHLSCYFQRIIASPISTAVINTPTLKIKAFIYFIELKRGNETQSKLPNGSDHVSKKQKCSQSHY